MSTLRTGAAYYENETEPEPVLQAGCPLPPPAAPPPGRRGPARNRLPVAAKRSSGRPGDRPLPPRSSVHHHLDPGGFGEVTSARLLESSALPDRTSLEPGDASEGERAQRRGQTLGGPAPRHPHPLKLVTGGRP